MSSMHLSIRYTLWVFFTLLYGTVSGAYTFNFYGHGESLPDAPILHISAPSYLNHNSLTQTLSELDRQSTQDFVQHLRYRSTVLNLDDVGTLLYLRNFLTQTIQSPIKRGILEWKILQTLGYDVLLTYTSNSVDVFALMALEPSASTFIYEKGKRYHHTNFKNSGTPQKRMLHHVSGHAVSGSKPIIHDTRKLPTVSARLKSKLRRFEYGGKKLELKAVTNLSLIQFLNDLPLFALGTSYIDRKLSAEAQASFLNPLRELIRPYKPASQAALLLNLVQQGFSYRTDEENHGFEKYNYPEETLTADYVDCEDKSLLYVYLLKELMNVPSVLLISESRQHVCVGSAIPGFSNGYNFKYKNRNYVVCEPTGLNYPLGKSAMDLAEISEVVQMN